VLNTGQDRKLAKIQSHIFRKISTSLESRPLYDHDAIVFEQIRWVLGALDVGQDFRKYKKIIIIISEKVPAPTLVNSAINYSSCLSYFHFVHSDPSNIQRYRDYSI
jgi:hypothetical protein